MCIVFLFAVLVTYLEGKEVQHEKLKEIENDQLSEEMLGIIYAGLLKLLRSALRTPQSSLKQEVDTSLRFA